MDIFNFLFFLFITILCLIPFGIALFYFILGVKSWVLGRKEKSRVKVISGYNGIFFSILSMVVIYFLWYWLIRNSLSWNY